MLTSRFIINLVVYQICWVGCILGGAHGQPWVGPLLVTAAVIYHLGTAARTAPEIKLIIAAAFVGAVWDSFLVATGWLVYPSGTLIENTAPYWIVALWIVFATTFNVSLAWFKTRLWAAAALGAIGGPLAYLAGERLGGVVITDRTAGLAALALGWTLWLPLMMHLARRWDGFTDREPRLAAAAG